MSMAYLGPSWNLCVFFPQVRRIISSFTLSCEATDITNLFQVSSCAILARTVKR